MCPLCSEIKFNFIGKPKISKKVESIVRLDYSIVQCTSCSFYYISPKLDLTSAEWQILYDDEYFEPMTNWHFIKREQDLSQRFNNLNKFTSHKVKRFLDVGCGEGYGLIKAANMGWESYGIDISDLRIPEAKADKINFVQSDLISAKFQENYFDCVYVDSVLEHVPNPLELLCELKRITSKGGTIYIGVPNEDSLFTKVLQIAYKLSGRSEESSRLKPFAPPFHIGGFTKDSLQFAIKKSGLSINKLRNFASKSDILNYNILSRGFFIAAFYLPISLLAIPLRMEVYFEAYLKK